MAYRTLSEDHEHDLDSLAIILEHFSDAYLDFDAEPHIDEVAELSSWARTLFEFGAQLEQHYGAKQTKLMFAMAWRQVKEG